MTFKSNDFLKYMESSFNYEYMPMMTINNIMDAVVSYGEMHFKNEDLRAFLMHTIGEAFDINDDDVDRFFASVQKKVFDDYCSYNRINKLHTISSSLYLYDKSHMDHEDAVEYSIALKQPLQTDDGLKVCYVLYQRDMVTSDYLKGAFAITCEDYSSGEYFHTDLPYIINIASSDPFSLACKMDFEFIDERFKDLLDRQWIKSGIDDLFTNPVLREPFINNDGGDLLNFYDKWSDKAGNSYLALSDENNQLWVGCESSDRNPDMSTILAYKNFDSSIPSYDTVESQYTKYLMNKQKGKDIE